MNWDTIKAHRAKLMGAALTVWVLCNSTLSTNCHGLFAAEHGVHWIATTDAIPEITILIDQNAGAKLITGNDRKLVPIGLAFLCHD